MSTGTSDGKREKKKYVLYGRNKIVSGFDVFTSTFSVFVNYEVCSWPRQRNAEKDSKIIFEAAPEETRD